MPVRVTLDALIVKKGLKARDLAAEVGLSETQLSLFRSGKVKGIRFRSLARLCAALDCRPGDLLDYDFNAADLTTPDEPEEAGAKPL
jgi:putative transcriptional regulator